MDHNINSKFSNIVDIPGGRERILSCCQDCPYKEIDTTDSPQCAITRKQIDTDEPGIPYFCPLPENPLNKKHRIVWVKDTEELLLLNYIQ